MSADLSKAYELLGVKPGFSSRELKAAHRDLAKVWHPDRFLHDPRLQAKAQEKLKEINEAYELLSSGRTPRASDTPDYSQVVKRQRRRTRSWQLPAVALFIFVAVFAITIRMLLQRRVQPVAEPDTQTEAYADQPASTRSEAPARNDATRKPDWDDAAPEIGASSSDSAPSEPTPALATVTVAIDPESGLLARSDCPVRSRMTYPRGNEPSGYCNIVHSPPPKESRIKSIAKTVRAPWTK